jgi:hypothetical protein
LPAVTVPFALNAGRSLASPSRVVSRRGHSSVSTTTSVTVRVAPDHCSRRTVIGTISGANTPFASAAAAFCCEANAKSSCMSRVIPQRWATRSAVNPMPM